MVAGRFYARIEGKVQRELRQGHFGAYVENRKAKIENRKSGNGT
jgi:hypothetical protein